MTQANVSDWQVGFAQWQAFSARVRGIVSRTNSMIDKDLRSTARKAGLDPQIATLHAHNAMCGMNSGKPWEEVDYSLARRVLWLEQRSFDVSRLGERVICRAYNRFSNPFKCAQYDLGGAL
jgi:hypothetical protein